MYYATKDLWDLAPNNTLFLLTSNHGGNHWDINEFGLNSIQVPMAFWGQGVKQKVNLFSDTIETPQIAPSLFDIVSLYSSSRILPSNQDLSTFDNIRAEQWTHTGITRIYERDYHKSVTYKTVFGHNDDDDDDEICIVPRSVNHRYVSNANLLIRSIFVFVFIILAFDLYTLQTSKKVKNLPK